MAFICHFFDNEGKKWPWTIEQWYDISISTHRLAHQSNSKSPLCILLLVLITVYGCYKLNTRSSHRIEKKCNCNVKNLILCSCRHCNLWNYFGGVSLGNPRKLILVLLSYFFQQSSRLSFNNLQSTVYHSVYHAYGSHYCLFFRVFFFKLHDPLKFF